MSHPPDDPAVEKTNIQASLKNDCWEIYHNHNGFNWRRTASNHEIVGVSHRAFTHEHECIANARLFGYEGHFNVSHRASSWEFYQDAQGEHRWRVSEGDVKLNVCHEGYKSELSAVKNAVRHGYGLSKGHTNRGCWMHLLDLVLIGACLLLILWLFRGGFEDPKASQVQPNPLRAHFEDVDTTDWHWDSVTRLAGLKILEGYKNEDGTPTGIYGPNDPITLEQMTKILVRATGQDQTTCQNILRSEVIGTDWSAPYFECARALGWTTFKDKNKDYRQDATRGEVAQALIEAFEIKTARRVRGDFEDVLPGDSFALAIEKLHEDRVISGYRGTQRFGPEQSTRRSEAAKMVHLTMQKYADR